MGHIFSRKKVSKVTEQDKAVLELKTTRDKIRQYQKKSESTLQRDRELAKQLLHKNKKERAKLLLRKKRFIEEKLNQADGQLENIEKLIQDIEYAQVEMKVVDSLKFGNDALKEINDLMSIEDIEKILDETQEAAEKQEEISALISGELLTDIDEEVLESELDALLKDALEKQLPEAPKDVKLPEVPKEVLPEVPKEVLPEVQEDVQMPKVPQEVVPEVLQEVVPEVPQEVVLEVSKDVEMPEVQEDVQMPEVVLPEVPKDVEDPELALPEVPADEPEEGEREKPRKEREPVAMEAS